MSVTSTEVAAGTTPKPAAENRTRNSTRARKKAGASIRTGVQAIIIVIWCLAPFYWMIVTAFRPVDYTYDTSLIPIPATLDNFVTAFSTQLGNHLLRAIGNSLIVGVSVTLIALVFGVTAAYALARLEFAGKAFLAGIILGASMFPAVALLTPLFQLFTNLGWTGTYQVLIIPSISFALPLTVYTLASFLREMPWDLEEAARVDGCTRFTAFIKIILPLAAPAVFTTAILAFIASWNEYLIASVLSTDATQTVTVAIAGFTGSQPHQEPYTAIMAAGTIVTVPLVILVLILQRKIVAGLTAGGVKG
ncbi:carbohydrate ABC transporter permease [Microbacterium rhizosphaerae]|uniref:Carbohydrate ABC transporter permease n=1 Tax=Microbacterium rhizosphaerae TaxID=1678237 RepID=A0ABZ0SKF2_9MICO|nr:carbohydrate ABC transporter permease [Microbacterium rhizosphaerae]WPR89379.1 carbohydrate ABC transporter permease [Microbacterium rhizosphaerae]